MAPRPNIQSVWTFENRRRTLLRDERFCYRRARTACCQYSTLYKLILFFSQFLLSPGNVAYRLMMNWILYPIADFAHVTRSEFFHHKKLMRTCDYDEVMVMSAWILYLIGPSLARTHTPLLPFFSIFNKCLINSSPNKNLELELEFQTHIYIEVCTVHIYIHRDTPS